MSLYAADECNKHFHINLAEGYYGTVAFKKFLELNLEIWNMRNLDGGL